MRAVNLNDAKTHLESLSAHLILSVSDHVTPGQQLHFYLKPEDDIGIYL